jgi:4-amino-4-deoxy-L-arabinose transferase-like glycosyltransferase
LPQFITFGNFVSNDALSFLIGTLTFTQAFAYIARPTRRNLLLLGVALGIGLLTKGTFIVFAPVLLLLVVVMGLRQGFTLKQHLIAIVLFCLVSGVIGSYKFIENTIYFGRPVIHNLDLDPYWAPSQMGTYQGLRSIIDINVFKLVRHPYISEPTKHSLPLLIYGTFWYSHIPESSFDTIRSHDLDIIPQAVYLVGTIPTLLMMLGGVAFLWRNRSLLDYVNCSDEEFVLRTQGKTAILMLALNLILVLRTGLKYDVWSCFQGRLLFPSMFAIMLLFGWGVETVGHRWAFTRPMLNIVLVAAYAILGSYFVVEVGYAAYFAVQALL